MRDMGTGLSSVMTAHFSSAGTALVKTFPSGHGPRLRSTSSSFVSLSTNWSLGTYSSSPSMLQVYSPA